MLPTALEYLLTTRFDIVLDTLCSEIAACALLLLQPLKGEPINVSAISSAVMAILVVVLELYSVDRFVICFIMLALLYLYLVYRLFERCRMITSPSMFRGWYASESVMRLIFAFILGLFVILTMLPGIGLVVRIAVICALFPFGAILLFRGDLCRFFPVTKAQPANLDRQFVPEIPPLQDKSRYTENEEASMRALYGKVLAFMQSNQPYLSDDFSLHDLAAHMLTNKSYLSRTINAFYGKNFRQFLNSYRVDFALNIMTEDPRVRIEELALMSGFHSATSFNMAFKLKMNVTPREYAQQLKLRKVNETADGRLSSGAEGR